MDISPFDLDDLAAVLGVTRRELIYSANNISKLVKHKVARKKSGEPRQLVAPNQALKEMQRRIKESFLEPYPYPDYIYGLGGDTLRQHAQAHGGNRRLVQVDLRDFFPSIDNRQVYRMWAYEFSLAPEVAGILTKLTTQGCKLQQGFPTSSHIAAIVAAPLTSEIKTYCDASDLAFTQYVDDLNFSGPEVHYREMFRLVVQTAQRYGFALKRNKTKTYNQATGKVVTGVSVYGARLRASREIRARAACALRSLSEAPDDPTRQNRAVGYARFLRHLNTVDGDKYMAKIEALIAATDATST